MSIESEIERLQIAKSNLKTAIMGKGVHVDDTDKLDTYYMLVSQIEEGSGGGGIDVSATTVTAGDVLAGKLFYDANGVLTEGTIEEALISGKDDKFGVSITSGYLPEPFEYYATNGTYEITQNKVVLKSGYFKAQTIDVGTRFTETSITPGTENYNIPSGSYIVSPLTIEGDENLIGDNIKSGVTIFGISGRYEGESSGFDTSDATVVSADLTAGTVAYGKDGKVYGSRIYAEDPMVYFHNGQLKAYQPVYLDPENPVTMYTFDGTASPDDVVEGESVYVAGGKVTGSMSHLTVGGMVIQENAMLSIPSKSYVDFENYQLRDIAGIGDLAAENIAKGKTICGIEGTYEGESSGSSMEIYKCVDAEGLTWWVVSGCGTPEANGRYYQGAELFDTYNMTFVRPFYQKDGSCSIEYKDGCWKVFSGGTVLYRDESWSYYDGDPSQCTGWVVESGVEPVPTITKETTTGNGWSGKLYDYETKSVSDDISDLNYSYATPQIGGYYTKDGEIKCEVAVLNDYMYRQSMTDIADLSYNGTKPTIGTFQGVPCMIFDGTGAFYKNLPTAVNSKFTFSIFRYIGTSNDANAMASIGKWESHKCIEAFQSGSFYWYPDHVGPSTAISKEQWYTQTVTYDGSMFTAYINGEKVGTYSTYMYAIEPILCLGSNFTSSGVPGRDRYIVGYLGDCSIWNRVLTPTEIMYNHLRMANMVNNGGSGFEQNGSDLGDTGS